jgi:hypothetical protein
MPQEKVPPEICTRPVVVAALALRREEAARERIYAFPTAHSVTPQNERAAPKTGQPFYFMRCYSFSFSAFSLLITDD